MSNSTQNIKEWAGDPMYPRNSTQNDMEKRFVTWALARDDDWWQEGHGAVSIWDVRIMLDFMVKELADARKEVIDSLHKEAEFVTYKKDGGHGLAVPVGKLLDVLATLREEEEPKKEKHGCCQCYCSMCRDMCFRSKCVVHTKEETK